MIFHNDEHGMMSFYEDGRIPRPSDIPKAHIHRVEIESMHDGRCETPVWHHEVPHPFKSYVLAQVFDQAGQYIQLPGSGTTWKQIPHGILIPVLNERYYPLMVVMTG